MGGLGPSAYRAAPAGSFAPPWLAQSSAGPSYPPPRSSSHSQDDDSHHERATSHRQQHQQPMRHEPHPRSASHSDDAGWDSPYPASFDRQPPPRQTQDQRWSDRDSHPGNRHEPQVRATPAADRYGNHNDDPQHAYRPPPTPSQTTVLFGYQGGVSNATPRNPAPRAAVEHTHVTSSSYHLHAPASAPHASLSAGHVSKDASLSDQLRSKDKLLQECLQEKRALLAQLQDERATHAAELATARARLYQDLMTALRHGGIVAVEQLGQRIAENRDGGGSSPKALSDPHETTLAQRASYFSPSTPLPSTRTNPAAREEAAIRVRNALALLQQPSKRAY